MSTATIEQLGEKLAPWLEAVRHGETVAIVDGGRIVARLTPPASEDTPAPQPRTLEWPDFAARQRRIFGEGFILPAGYVDSIINEDRGEW